MNTNPMALMKLMNAWNQFKENHPKFPAFMNAAANGYLQEGSIIEINITDAQGKKIGSNIKLTASDMELFNQLKNL